jgi:hypothetical protein
MMCESGIFTATLPPARGAPRPARDSYDAIQAGPHPKSYVSDSNRCGVDLAISLSSLIRRATWPLSVAANDHRFLSVASVIAVPRTALASYGQITSRPSVPDRKSVPNRLGFWLRAPLRRAGNCIKPRHGGGFADLLVHGPSCMNANLRVWLRRGCFQRHGILPDCSDRLQHLKSAPICPFV